jgi:hypothetical protein
MYIEKSLVKGYSEEWCLLGRYAVWLDIPEDGVLHSHRRENLKSYKGYSDPCKENVDFVLSAYKLSSEFAATLTCAHFLL